MSFVEYFFDQGFDEELVFLAVRTTFFLAVFAAALFFLRRRLGVQFVQAVATSTAVVVVVAIIGITLYEAGALWFRSVPHGSGHERREAGFEDFVSSARTAFVVLYAGLIILAVGCGLVLGRRRTGRGTGPALATAVAVVAYLGLMLPFVEFLTACNVGRAFLIDEVSC